MTIQSLPLHNSVPTLDLVAEAQQSPQAFAALYRRHVQRVYRYLLAKVGQVDDAQDLTSITFMTALERIHSFRGTGSFEAWLLRIARNKANDHFRRKRPIVALDNVLLVSDSAESPATITDLNLQIDKVSLHLRQIAPDRAEAITLRIFGGLSVAEVAEVMGRKQPAVRMLLHRGLQDLRQRMEVTP